jgi:hypothetical protein
MPVIVAFIVTGYPYCLAVSFAVRDVRAVAYPYFSVVLAMAC